MSAMYPSLKEILARFLQLVGTINIALSYKVRPETGLKLNKSIKIPISLYGSEVWASTIQ